MALGGIARLGSTKKLEMIVMVIVNVAIYTSTHRFCTHITGERTVGNGSN